MIDLSIERLPVEIIHRIFDHLDIETIIFSVRPLCRQLRSIITTYNRYILNFHEISKLHFYIFCRLINPENVISLTLSNDNRTSNQIDLFISFHHLQQFTRLRSLTLLRIDESQLELLTSQLHLNLLKSFSLDVKQKSQDVSKEITIDLASLFIQTNSQEKDKLSIISLPLNCSIQYLTINNRMSIENLSKIFECCPQLHTLTIYDIPDMFGKSFSRVFPQLLSLTVNELSKSIDNIESFLRMTPSLIYLKLLGNGEKVMNGKYWSEIITTNLSQLNQFEFYFSRRGYDGRTPTHVKSIISSFQTPFWMEDKKWFVTCDCDISSYYGPIDLYSIPICRPYFTYEAKSNKFYLSTYPTPIYKDPSIKHNVTSLRLKVNKFLADDIAEKKTTINYPIFQNTTTLRLSFDEFYYPSFLLQSLSIYIDISRIVHMQIYAFYNGRIHKNFLLNIKAFIEQAHKLSSLDISGMHHTHELDQVIDIIHSISPRRIKHLTILIANLEELKFIFEQCENLATIKFERGNKKIYVSIIKWFAENTINTTYHEGEQEIVFWIGEKHMNKKRMIISV